MLSCELCQACMRRHKSVQDVYLCHFDMTACDEVVCVQVDEFELPMEISGELRLYQRAGISWLAFLRRCGLHGVLADEMGLGKTLQATAIVVCKALLAVLSDTRILFKQAVRPWTMSLLLLQTHTWVTHPVKGL